MKRITLTIRIEWEGGETIEAGKFVHFPEAWDAMNDLADGVSTIRLVDDRGVTHSMLVGWDWCWK